MTKIIMRTTLAHPVYGCAGPGGHLTVDDDTAKALIAGGYAFAVGGEALLAPTRESAAMGQPETAVQPKPARKSR